MMKSMLLLQTVIQMERNILCISQKKTLEDMSDELLEKFQEYLKDYDNLTPTYQEIMEKYMTM